MDVEKAIEEISKLDKLADKLKYYNDNVSLLIGIDNFQHQVGFGIGREHNNLFCLCEHCEGKFSISDFRIYRDIRNQEIQKVVDFFESKNDYKPKIEFYFKISQGFSTTIRTLFFVPDELQEIDMHKFPYKNYTINITPKDTNEITILKNHLKHKLLTDKDRIYIPMAQFTFEKRVENIEKYLKIRIDKNRREELLQSEYDKINLSKVDIYSKKPYDKTLFKILTVVENIIRERHNEFYSDFRKLEITILAEDTIKYEQYLNNLSLPIDQQQTKLSSQERNTIKLIQYYNCIKNVRLFKEAILNRDNDLYFNNSTRSFIENRNDDLLKNEVLNSRIGWLKPFNSNLKDFLVQTVCCFKYVIEWKDNNTDLHENTLEIRLSREMEFFRMLPDSLRKNYDSNNDFLVLKMREYYINGFQMMLDFLKTNLLIDLESSPFYDRIREVINDIKNAVDFESLKLSLSYQTMKNEDVKTNSNPINFIKNDSNEITDLITVPLENKSIILDQIDRNLWNWHQEFEKTNYYIEIPLAIEEKKDYVVDNFFNYEERNYKSQLKICDIILQEVPGEEKILGYKKNFENKLFELRRDNPIPDWDINKLFAKINSAFHLLEKFMDGTLSEYKSFLFNDHFTLLFNELSKPQNNNPECLALKDGYFELLYQISIDYDKSTFENQEAYSNECFNRDCNEIDSLRWDRLSEFLTDESEDLEIEKPSIMKVILNSQKNSYSDELINKESNLVNPFPKIFKNHKAFTIFKNLLEEFGNTKENLSNYSFVFHKMTYEDLIHNDLKQKAYYEFLSKFNISIDRVKPLADIGKISYRESIYTKAKI
jgi:hypothetical protein